jgi:hypothetical protein
VQILVLFVIYDISMDSIFRFDEIELHFPHLINERKVNSVGKFHIALPKYKFIKIIVVASECYIQRER